MLLKSRKPSGNIFSWVLFLTFLSIKTWVRQFLFEWDYFLFEWDSSLLHAFARSAFLWGDMFDKITSVLFQPGYVQRSPEALPTAIPLEVWPSDTLERRRGSCRWVSVKFSTGCLEFLGSSSVIFVHGLRGDKIKTWSKGMENHANRAASHAYIL